jgi:hypothetical protein
LAPKSRALTALAMFLALACGSTVAQSATPAPFCANGRIISKSQALVAFATLNSNMDLCLAGVDAEFADLEIGEGYCDQVWRDLDQMVGSEEQAGQNDCFGEWWDSLSLDEPYEPIDETLIDQYMAYSEKIQIYLDYRWNNYNYGQGTWKWSRSQNSD